MFVSFKNHLCRRDLHHNELNYDNATDLMCLIWLLLSGMLANCAVFGCVVYDSRGIVMCMSKYGIQ